jgi:superfamily II helicase
MDYHGEEITAEKFDDIRQIILIQNGVDFDINEFINRDTEEALRKAQEFENEKNNEKATIEDCIDSVVVGLETSEEYVENLSFERQPIIELWPSQVESINDGLFSKDNNYIIKMPTSSGKTLIAEIAILQSLINNEEMKCIYLLDRRNKPNPDLLDIRMYSS